MKNFINLIKSYIRRKYIFFPKIKIEKKWIGNNYGGFYINPGILDTNSIVFSFGIGEDISFDNGLIQEYNLKVHGFDPIPKSIEYINRQLPIRNFSFHPFRISETSGEKTFFLPKNPTHISGSLHQTDIVDHNNSLNLDFKSLNDILKDIQIKHIDILKMDIEGSEYDVIDSILSLGIVIKQILIEFHPQMFGNGRKLTRNSFKKLEDKGFKCFAVSETFSEFSFINLNYVDLENS